MSAEHPTHPPRLGHAGRLSLPPRARFLISAQLIVFALSLEDEEIVEAMAAHWDLSARSQTAAEILLSVALLAAWAVLTLGWVRLVCDPCRARAD